MMSGCLVEIMILLDWFTIGLLTEKQLEYALWIYGPGMSLNEVAWQLECLCDVKLPRFRLWALST